MLKIAFTPHTRVFTKIYFELHINIVKPPLLWDLCQTIKKNVINKLNGYSPAAVCHAHSPT